jgi:hypothetical protein
MKNRSFALALVGLLSFGCGPEEDPEPLTQPNVPVESAKGYYTIECEPESGGTWPEWALGPTTIKANIVPGPDPLPDDPWVSARLPADPPYKLKVNAPLAETDERAPLPEVMPLDAEGKHWAVGPLDLAAKGIWIFEVEISNEEGVTDTVELRFEVK